MKITHNLKIQATPEKIYRAVSTKEGINGWWSKDCTVSEKIGGKSVLKFDKKGTIVQMDFQTTKLIPNKKVIWTCTGNGNPMWLGTQIETEIDSSRSGSEVIFSHTNFDPKWADDPGFEMIKEGWKHFVGSLVSFCEGGKGSPW